MKLKDKGTKSRIDLLMRGKLLYHFAGLMAVLLNYAEVPPLCLHHRKPNGLVLKIIIKTAYERLREFHSVIFAFKRAAMIKVYEDFLFAPLNSFYHPFFWARQICSI